MPNFDEKIINDISEIVSTFSKPFPTEMVSDGWSIELWHKWGLIFISLLNSVQSGSEISNASLARAMDFDGIIKGDLLGKAAAISNALHN